ncbi:hypothetical protein WJX79_001149 [Trebouxia sp. C0005]
MASDASLDTGLLASEKRYKTQLGHAKEVAVSLPECEEAAANGISFEQNLSCGKRKKVTSNMTANTEISKLPGLSPGPFEAFESETLCATPVQADIFGGFKGSLLGPLTTAEAAHVAEIAGSTDELRRVEVDTNDVCTVSSCALSDQACCDAPQISSGPVPELGLPTANDRSITTLKYSAAPASPDIMSTSGSSMTGSAVAFNRGGEAEQRFSAPTEPQQPRATDEGDALTDTDEILPVKPFPVGVRQRLMLAATPVACLKKQASGRASQVVVDLTQD